VPQAARPAAGYAPPGDAEEQEVGWPQMADWLLRHRVSLAAGLLIAAQLVWKAAFLSNFYFRDDDFHFTEISLQSSLGWKYLSYVGSGHFHPGVLAIIWVMARLAPYNWDAASAITLVMLLIAGLAAWRLLRTLLGNRPAILIPLVLYLVTPLTLPNDSWWQSAIESLPLQAAIFLALDAHVRYVRSGRYRHALAAAAWLAIGLIFFEKAAVIPVVLFAVTAAFLIEGSLEASLRTAIVSYWRAWVLYAVIVIVYGFVLLHALSKSTVTPGAPTSATNALIFAGSLTKDTLLPGLLGGPWSWVLPRYGAVAYAATASQLAWLAVLVCIAVMVASVLTRSRAWRAWAILGIWLVLADILPVFIGRLSISNLGGFLSLDTRYVADAAGVAAVCVGLAFWPLARPETAGRANEAQPEVFTGRKWRAVAIGLTGVLVVGSIWSVHSYEKVTSVTNAFGRLYLANARTALADLSKGTVIFDQYMPPYVMVEAFYETDALQSRALAPMASKATAADTRWTLHPSGNIDHLVMFGPDGKLHQALIRGTTSVPVPKGKSCWPFRNGRAVLRFPRPTSAFSGIVRLGYLAGGPAVGGETVTVTYGSYVRQFTVEPGLHYVYIQAAGSAGSVTVTPATTTGICFSNAVAGNLTASVYPLAPGQG
jgi:hypothetical protein